MEMVGAYATFANQGLRMKPFLIDRITDRDGNVDRGGAPQATRRDPGRHRVHPDAPAARGGRAGHRGAGAAALSRPIAGKTGTTNDFTDAWFIGFEPSLAAGVWVGFDEKKDSLGKDETGATRRCPSGWTSGAGHGREAGGGVSRSPATSSSCRWTRWAARAAPGTPGVQMEAFVAGTEPRAVEGAPPTEP